MTITFSSGRSLAAVVVAVVLLISLLGPLGPGVVGADSSAAVATDSDEMNVASSDGEYPTQSPDDVDVDPALEAAVADGGTTIETVDDEPLEVVVRMDVDRSSVATAAADDSPAGLKKEAAATQNALEAFADAHDGVEIRTQFWIANAVLLEIDPDDVALEAIAGVSGVERLHTNFEVEVSSATGTAPIGEPTIGSAASSVSTTSSETTYGLEQINATTVWDAYGTRGEGTRVAVLDTGVDATHPDIDLYTDDSDDESYPGGWAEFDSSGDRVDGSTPHDTGSHGTHVSGTVAGGNESGTAIGVAPDVELMHGLVLPDGSGTFAQILAGMEWATANDADVISMSLGSEGYNSDFIDPVHNAQNAGVVVVSSSGNDGEGTSSSPGNIYDVFSIGASDSSDAIASFSSGEKIDTDQVWGNDAPEDWPEEYVVPNVAAPGDDVVSAIPDEGYGVSSGTSMAAPHVAGAIALLLSIDGDLEADVIESTLEETAWKPDGEPGEQDTRYGHGIIDVTSAAREIAPNGTITGNVTASGDSTVFGTDDLVAGGDGIENASVSVANDAGATWTTTTGENGSYEVADLPPTTGAYGGYTVTVDGGANYTTVTESNVDVAPNETTTLNVELDYAETGTVEGTVSIDVVAPDESIPVTIESEDDPASEPIEVVLEHGTESAPYTLENVSLAVDGDERPITASAPDYDSVTVNVSVEPNETTGGIDLELERESGTLDGWYALEVTETSAPVTAGEPLDVTVDVENLAANDTQTVTLVAGDETVDQTSIALEAGESTTTTLTYETSDDDVPAVELAVRSEDDERETTERVHTPSPATFDVSDLAVSDPAVGDEWDVGETISIATTVTNVGDRNGTEEVTLTFDGETVDAQSRELAGGANETVEFEFEIPGAPRAGDHDVTVAVASPDDEATTGGTVDYGSIQSGIDALERDGDGAIVGDGVVSVAAGVYGETVTVDEQGVTIRGADPSGAVLQPDGDVGVEIVASDVTVSRLTVDPDPGETGVRVVSADDVTLSRVVIDGGETGVDVTDSSGLSVAASTFTAGETGLVLENATDADLSGVDVDGADGIVLTEGATGTLREVNLSVANDALTIASSAGSGIHVERNNLVGANASVVLGATVSTAGLESVARTESGDATFDANHYDGTVVGTHDDDNAATEPYEPAAFTVSIDSLPDTVTVGDTLEVEATVENTGDRSGTQDVVLEVGGTAVDAADDLTLEGGETSSVALAYVPDETDVGSDVAITVETDDDSASDTVGVLEQPAFDLSALDAPSKATQGEAESVTVTVTNAGGDGTDTLSLRVGSDLEEPGSYTELATEEVSLAAGETRDVTLEGAIPADEPTGFRVAGVVSDADLAEAILEVGEADVDDPGDGDDGDGNDNDDGDGDDGGGSGGGGQSGGQGGQGGGGGSSAPHTPAPWPPSDVSVTEEVRSPIRSDSTTGGSVVRFDRVGQRSAIERISFAEPDLAGDVRVREYDRSSAVTGAPPGGTVLPMEIHVPRGVELLPATVEFRLESAAYASLEADAENVHLARYHDDGWHVLETTVVGETADGAVFEAETPGFSHFAIVAVGEPTAVATVDPASVAVGEEVTLDGADSSDRFGTIESYEWTVGDESYAGETATVALEEPGEYDVTLTVINDAGETDTATTTLTVTDADDGLLEGDGIPGFGVVLAVGTVLAAVGLHARLLRGP